MCIIEGAGEYTVTVTYKGVANIGLRVKAINAPQEVVFDQGEVDSDGKKHYYIFDDHPEFIRKCDLLDNTTYSQQYPPTSLMHTGELEPGIYTLFTYHHIALNDNPMFSFGMPFNKDENVYFDSIFYKINNDGKVKINKLGLRCSENSYKDQPESTNPPNPWDRLFDVWKDYNESQFCGFDMDTLNLSININDSTKYKLLTNVLNEKSLPGEQPLNVLVDGDINIHNKINEALGDNDEKDIGYVWIMMEFEVTEGKVAFADIAYASKYNAGCQLEEAKNQGNLPDLLESTYENIETIKGIGDASQTIKAKEMYYYIDESIPDDTLLPFIISNPFIENSKQKIFTTNVSPFTPNNRWTTPISSEVSLEFDGIGVIRETPNVNPAPTPYISTPGPTSTVSPSEGEWHFDTMHSKLTISKNMPMPSGSSGSYSILPGEMVDIDWLKSFSSINDTPYLALEGREDASYGDRYMRNTVTLGLNGYGITQEYTIHVFNFSNDVKRLSYLVNGNSFIVDWTVNNSLSHFSGTRRMNLPDWLPPAVQVFYVDLPPNEETVLNVYVTLMTGSSSAIQNGFVLNGTISIKSDAYLDENNNVHYSNEKTWTQSLLSQRDITQE